MADIDEPKITINGKVLNDAQAMVIRVAINSFKIDLQSNGLGDDEHGKIMTKLYLERIKEIGGYI